MFDGRDHAAHFVDAAEVVERGLLHLIGELFDVVASTKRVRRFGDPGFVRQDLLRAERQRDGVLGRQGVSFIERIGVQGLAAAQYRGEPL